MTLSRAILMAGFSGLIGIAAGYLIRHFISVSRKESAELKIQKLLLDAKAKTQAVLEEANKKASQILEEAKKEEKSALSQVRKLEERILTKEDLLEKRRFEVEKESRDIQEKIAKVKKIRDDVEALEAQKRQELIKISGLTEEQAKEALFKDIEKKYEGDILLRLQKLEKTSHK